MEMAMVWDFVRADPGRAAMILLGLLAAFSLLLLLLARSLSVRTGVDGGARVLASDTGQNRSRTYRSTALKLSGSPDYVLEERVGPLRRKKLVPVEKKTFSARELYESQKLQIGVYLALMKEAHGSECADYGYVIYKNGRFRVDWTPGLVDLLNTRIEEARAVKATLTGHRTHDNPRQCATCAFRRVCPEALA